ncbi:MAG: aconitase X, partial [Armatimonadota bacterium]
MTDEEQNILDGRRGPVLRKALRAIVRYGEAFGADRLVPIVSSHLVIGTGALLFIQYARMLRETADAGLVFPVPTTVNPRAYDLDDASLAVRLAYPRQRTMEALLTKLGCADTFTCTPYLADNVPAAGDCITWAESSAAVYANSVLGARTNVTPAPMDLMYAILGRAPEYGLLRDEGRLAVCRVVVHPDANSEPALLGYAIGLKVQRGVPWVEGIDCTPDSFKDMSAAANCAGLLPLIHVPGFTYEARQLGESLVRPDATTVRITREDVAAARSQLRGFDCTPTHVVLGCPHLSVEQV